MPGSVVVLNTWENIEIIKSPEDNWMFDVTFDVTFDVFSVQQLWLREDVVNFFYPLAGQSAHFNLDLI